MTTPVGNAVGAGADAGINASQMPGEYGQAAMASGLMGPGAGFKFDKDQLQELVKDWENLADEYKKDQEHAQALIRVKPPGADYASGSHADMVVGSGKALLESLLQKEKYCRTMADKFTQALGKYATAEETAVDATKQAGGSL